MSSDGKRILTACADDKIRVLDSSDGSKIETVPGDDESYVRVRYLPNNVGFRNSGERLRLRFWRDTDHELIPDYGRSLGYLPAEDAVWTRNGLIADAADGDILAALNETIRAASPNGDLLIVERNRYGPSNELLDGLLILQRTSSPYYGVGWRKVFNIPIFWPALAVTLGFVWSFWQDHRRTKRIIDDWFRRQKAWYARDDEPRD